MRRRPKPRLALLSALLALLPACATRPHPELTGSSQGLASPFAPAALSIHPLTRVDRNDKGQLLIICHVELRDAWGDTCKGVGKLSVQLYRPVGGRASGRGTLELSWDVDLTDLDRNKDLFDQATRTYRLELRDAPAWLAEPHDKKSDLPLGRLRAVLVSTGPRGEERVLQDEFPLGG